MPLSIPVRLPLDAASRTGFKALLFVALAARQQRNNLCCTSLIPELTIFSCLLMLAQRAHSAKFFHWDCLLHSPLLPYPLLALFQILAKTRAWSNTKLTLKGTVKSTDTTVSNDTSNFGNFNALLYQ